MKASRSRIGFDSSAKRGNVNLYRQIGPIFVAAGLLALLNAFLSGHRPSMKNRHVLITFLQRTERKSSEHKSPTYHSLQSHR
jgi:hypothetical protein